MHMYRMKNDQDYRTSITGNGHGVILIKRENEIETAYGHFKTIEEDMKEVTEEEENKINASIIY